MKDVMHVTTRKTLLFFFTRIICATFPTSKNITFFLRKRNKHISIYPSILPMQAQAQPLFFLLHPFIHIFPSAFPLLEKKLLSSERKRSIHFLILFGNGKRTWREKRQEGPPSTLANVAIISSQFCMHSFISLFVLLRGKKNLHGEKYVSVKNEWLPSNKTEEQVKNSVVVCLYGLFPKGMMA